MREAKRRARNFIIPFAFAALFFPASGFAQGEVSADDSSRVQTIADTLKIKLALADSQAVKIANIFLENIAEMRDIKQKYGEDREISGMMAENARERRNRNVMNVLSKDQLKKFELIQSEVIALIKDVNQNIQQKNQNPD